MVESRKSPNGRFRVLGVDKFSVEDWVAGEFDTAEEALGFARKKSEEARPCASDHSIATIYYAYDPDGNYLGGDTWPESERNTYLTELLKVVEGKG